MKKQRLVNWVVLLVVFFSMISFAQALEPAKSDNEDSHGYTPYASRVTSYLYEDSGNLVRVEYLDDHVVVEYYTMDFQIKDQQIVELELPKWGGFFAGKNYNYIISGQNNMEEDDNVEVIRVVKYSKDWERLDSLSLYGLNTKEPFRSGSLRCAESKDSGTLYIHTCHTMYKSDDGLNHQCNLTLGINQSTMDLEDASGVAPYLVDIEFPYYVSHSFDQHILVDQEGYRVLYDHGDAYPRSAVLMRGSRRVDIQEFAGSIGANVTNASLGGLAETVSGYVTAYHYQDGNVFLSYTPKDDMTEEATKITQLYEGEEWNPFGKPTPVLAPTGLDGGYVMWYGVRYVRYDPPQNNVVARYFTDFCYATYDKEGNVGQTQTAEASLSDCKPIFVDGKIIWYVTKETTPVFYVLDETGVAAFPTQLIAQPSTQTVNVDGKNVEFAMYALGGGSTNYIRVRDLAARLNGTAAQFEVGWNGNVTLTGSTPYTGSTDRAPFNTEMPYTNYTSPTYVNGRAVSLEAIQITHNDGGYTYYKLRDLAQALGFNVGWAADKGVFVETNKPYNPNN